MPDAFGDRAVFSVVLPVTNAMVEPDMADLRPRGVTNQTFRFPFPGLPDTVEALMELLGATLDTVSSCGPDRVVVAYTPEYMADGVEVTAQLRRFVEDRTGLAVTMASDAVTEALKALDVKRIGLVTPFLPAANVNVVAYFEAHGISVVSEAGFSSAQKGGTYTALISEAEVGDAFARVDSPDVDALVQVGTALACAGFVDALEARHDKPVVAINNATYWLALREHGITDHLDGHGVLLARH